MSIDLFLEIKEFIIIWNKYYNVLPINVFEFDKYVKIINKLRNRCVLEFKNKITYIELIDIIDITIFRELIEVMADAIYTVENCSDKYSNIYEMNYYQQTKIYDELELNCCSHLLNYLEQEAELYQINEYDKAFEKNIYEA